MAKVGVPPASPGKAPVHVAAVDRGHSRVLDDRRVVQRRKHDQPPVHALRVELSDQSLCDDLAFVLVAVVAGAHQRGGSATVADAGDRHGDDPVGVAVVRVPDLEPAHPASGRLEIDAAVDAGRLGAHAVTALVAGSPLARLRLGPTRPVSKPTVLRRSHGPSSHSQPRTSNPRNPATKIWLNNKDPRRSSRLEALADRARCPEALGSFLPRPRSMATTSAGRPNGAGTGSPRIRP